MTTEIQSASADNKLVGAEGLLIALFSEGSRPSLRWVREQQRRRAFPFIKVGKFVMFDPVQVRSALAQRFTVGARKESAT
jgi:hypothetical protein